MTNPIEGDKLDQFQQITESYVTDMNAIAVNYQEQNDQLQQQYQQTYKQLVQGLADEMKKRSLQYTAEIKAILES
jgi:surfactin synthase thioesterase subunit